MESVKSHTYSVDVAWTGDRGSGTDGYRNYGRDHVVSAVGKPDLLGSADASFLGDAERWNPEELLLTALSQCHMLWYLGIAAASGVVVVAYTDRPTATMTENPDGSGEFSEAVLHPEVTVADPSMVARAESLHPKANAKCFIARSVNFPVHHRGSVHVQ